MCTDLSDQTPAEAYISFGIETSAYQRQRMKVSASAAITLSIGLILGGCELLNDVTSPDPGSTDTIVFSSHIQPLFDTHCTGCHSGETADAGLRFDSWSNTMLGSKHGEAVIPYAAGHSLMIRLVTDLPGDPHPVNEGNEGLSAAEVALLERWIDEGALDDDGTVPFADSNDLLYVCNRDEASISVIDTKAKLVIRRLDLVKLGFTENAAPYDVVVEPGGEQWYVSLAGDNAVLKFSRANELVAQAAVTFPGLLALHPTNGILYAGRALNSAQAPASIVAIRRSDMFVDEIPVVFSRPHALAVRPQGDVVFSAGFDVDQLMAIQSGTSSVTFTPITGPLHSMGHFAISPDGNWMWGSGWASSLMTLFDISNPQAVQQRQSIPVAADPRQAAILPNSSALYISGNQDDVVTVVDFSSTQVRKVISGNGMSEPNGIAVTGDNRFVFVSNANTAGGYIPRYDFRDNDRTGTVVVIDTAIDEIVKVIEVGKRASGLGMKPGAIGF